MKLLTKKKNTTPEQKKHDELSEAEAFDMAWKLHPYLMQLLVMFHYILKGGYWSYGQDENRTNKRHH